MFVTVLHPRLQTDPAVQLATAVEGLGVIGARIPRMLRDEIVLFSAAADGAAPAGPIAFPLDRMRGAKLRLFNLTAGARYHLDVVDGTAVLTPAQEGGYLVDAQGVLTVDAPAASRLDLTDLALTPDGRMQFAVTGTAGLAYALERSSDLVTWETVATGTVGAGGETYTEPAIPPGDRRFYRARSLAGTP